jgi:hypothetical protein
LARLAISLAAAILAIPVGGSVALAQSGDLPFSIGWFNTDNCSALRMKTGVQGDVLFACDPAGEACDIDLPGNSTNMEARSGVSATAFCSDSFPIGGAFDPTADVLKPNAVVQGSSFTSITGVKTDTGADTEAANIVCSTFTLGGPFTVGTGKSARVYGPGVRACRKIVAGSGPSPATCPGEKASYFVTLDDDCTEVQALVTGSVAASAPSFAFALFIDGDTTPGSVSQPGRQALLVCPGYQAQCVTEADRDNLSSVVVDYRLPFITVQTPGSTTTTSGSTITCCLKSTGLKCPCS